jgi:hypothetical protein
MQGVGLGFGQGCPATQIMGQPFWRVTTGSRTNNTRTTATKSKRIPDFFKSLTPEHSHSLILVYDFERPTDLSNAVRLLFSSKDKTSVS